MPPTIYLQNNLVQHSLGIAAYTPPTTTYTALFTASPTQAYSPSLASGTPLPPPSGVTVGKDPNFGGSWRGGSGTWYYQVTAVSGGETTGSQEVSMTYVFTFHPGVYAVQQAWALLQWNAVPGATSYNVYRSTTSGGEGTSPTLLRTQVIPTYIYDDGSTTPTAGSVPVTNTTVTITHPAYGKEVTVGAYARQLGSWSISGNKATNTSTITFPTATANWGVLNAIGVFDAATNGNLLWYAPLTPAITVNQNDVVSMPAGTMTVQLV